MKKYRFVLVIICILLCLGLFKASAQTLVFNESDKAVVNPARGFYVQFDAENTSKVDALRKDGITLVLLAYDIDYFVKKKIGNTKLNELREALEDIRESGLKVVFRTAYGFGSYYKYRDPDDVDQVLSHIEQVSQIINENKDVVLCVQAGFIGPYGEWHSSNLLTGNEVHDTEVRNAVIRGLLDNLDSNIKVNIRRPRFIRDAAEFGLDSNRLGFHNDALLSTSDDMGTYDDDEFSRLQELEWVSNHLKMGINGGEMPSVGELSSSGNALFEFEKLHLTYLNSKYNKDVLSKWKKEKIFGQNAFNYINNHLGYRLWIQSSKQNDSISPNGKLSLDIVLKNSGFAPIYDRYNVEIVIRDERNIYSYPLKTVDLTSIGPNESHSINARLNLPDVFYGDRIQIGIRISDPNETLKDDIRYNVQLANENSTYKDGINYFAQYVLSKGKYVLKYL